jgi:hypothetical protein
MIAVELPDTSGGGLALLGRAIGVEKREILEVFEGTTCRLGLVDMSAGRWVQVAFRRSKPQEGEVEWRKPVSLDPAAGPPAGRAVLAATETIRPVMYCGRVSGVDHINKRYGDVI